MSGQQDGSGGDRPSGVTPTSGSPAANRDVYFRPTRYTPEDFAPLVVSARLRGDDGRVHPLVLHNLSQAGAAVAWPGELPLKRGEEWATFEVQIGEWLAWSGTVRIESLRSMDGVVLAGVSLLEGLLDVAEALRLRDVAAWKGKGLPSPSDPDPEVPGSDRFRALVAGLRLYLDDAERWYGALEAQLPWEVVHGDAAAPAHRALRARVMVEFVTGFVQRSDAINAAWLAVSERGRKQLRGFARRLLHDHFMRSPLMRRALEKPLGYPGDYEVMLYMYEDHFAGASLYAKALTLAILHTRSCEAVRTRKDFVRTRLQERIDRAEAPLRVLSVAAGPAQEIFELVMANDFVHAPVEVVLFDQDPAALGKAYTRLRDAVRRKPTLAMNIVYLKEDIIKPRVDVLTSGGHFDFIFSCGLFDYLKPIMAIARAETLFQCLRPGGQLYIGNMVPESPARWMMELHLEWDLWYRSRAEMLEIGARAAPTGRCSTAEESSGVNPFLLVERGG